jgi:hypothetical protein
MNKVIAKAALHTQVAVVNRRIERRRGLVDKIILDMEIKRTAHATIGTDSGDDAFGFDHGISKDVETFERSNV